jgi:hypothetical protein
VVVTWSRGGRSMPTRDSWLTSSVTDAWSSGAGRVLEDTEDGFALRLSDNSLRVVPGLNSDLAEYVGSALGDRLRG